MEKLLVTQALDERDLLVKRIQDAIDKSSFVDVLKPNDERTYGSKKNVAEYEKDVESSLQSIKDLIARYKRLDAAILLANATTNIEVAGITMTRAAAINLRKSLLHTSVSNGTNFEKNLIRKMQREFDEAKVTISRSQEVADRQREAMTNSLASIEKKNLNEDSLNSISAYCDNLVYRLVDPIGVENTIFELKKKQEELVTGLESAIKISNATTYVEF